MAEENQVTTKENQVITKENQVTTKNPEKVEAGRRLTEYNHKKREELKTQAQKNEVLTSSQYGIGVVLVVGVIDGFSYYLYKSEKREVKNVVPPHQPCPKDNKFEME